MNNSTTEAFVMMHSTSEVIEMFYQLAFFIIGTPINIFAFVKTSRNVREGGVESRLVKLSRQLLIAHIMVLFMYGIWRSYWIYNIVWTQGDIMCRVFSFLCALPFHLWSNMVAAIAIDMLCCITSPLSSYRTGANRVNWLITLAWVFAIVCASPMSILRGIIQINDEDMYQCYPRTDVFNEDILIAFNLFHVITSFYIPLFIVIICYLAIGFSIRKQMAERRLLQVLALLRIVCISESCQEIVSKLNWLQAIIIASTCINPFLYRFGTEPKRNSYYCSTMDTAGSRSVRRSTTVREAEAQRVAAAANRARERVEPNNAATVSPRDTRATVREQARVPNRLKNTKSNEV
uniref:G_PROTEIN_RECEP_F1_2 domain-containing protein n=1 Tax=Caenorhabditis tropicalis TaxID=1561998 RepID=A0A1I7U0L2_9PELO